MEQSVIGIKRKHLNRFSIELGYAKHWATELRPLLQTLRDAALNENGSVTSVLIEIED